MGERPVAEVYKLIYLDYRGVPRDLLQNKEGEFYFKSDTNIDIPLSFYNEDGEKMTHYTEIEHFPRIQVMRETTDPHMPVQL